MPAPAASRTGWRGAARSPRAAHGLRGRVELRFDIAASTVLSEHQRERLLAAFGDDVRVVVDDERSQLRNRTIARERLAGRLRNARVESQFD